MLESLCKLRVEKEPKNRLENDPAKNQGAAIWYSKPLIILLAKVDFILGIFLLNVLINEVFELIHAHSFFFLPILLQISI